MNPLEDLLSRLERVQALPTGNYRASCPICNKDSLIVTRSMGLTCKEGCDAALIGEVLHHRTPRPAEAASEDWEALTPFGVYALPSFPTQTLPDWLRRFVEALSLTAQTPPDMAGLLSLCACAVALAKVAEVSLGPDWYEPLNLYGVIAMPPASRKSAVLAAVCKPLERFEREQVEQEAARIDEAETERDILAGRLQKAKQDAAHGKTQESRLESEDKARELARELAAFTVPAALRLLTDDCTPERLAGLLAEQGGRIAVLSPEGDTFDLLSGRYSEGNSNLGVYLKGHAGDSLRVDRIGRKAEFIANPALTLGLAVQPEVLRGIARKPGLRGRGLLARFLYALPASNLGYRSTSAPELPAEVKAAYEACLLRLLRLTPYQPSEGKERPHVLNLEPDARDYFTAFRACVEQKLRPGEELGDLTDWGGKLPGAVARLAGLLHLAEWGEVGLENRVLSAATLRNAVQLGQYFTEHAKAAFTEMGADADTDNARYMLEWIERKQIHSFKKSEAHYALQGRFKRATDLDRPLEILCERNYLRERPAERKSEIGRKPGAVYEVHPALI